MPVAERQCTESLCPTDHHPPGSNEGDRVSPQLVPCLVCTDRRSVYLCHADSTTNNLDVSCCIGGSPGARRSDARGHIPCDKRGASRPCVCWRAGAAVPPPLRGAAGAGYLV